MPTLSLQSKIVITGAAGLVGQNLLLLLREKGYRNAVAIDRHAENLAIAAQLNPKLQTCCADLAEAGEWQQCFAGAEAVIQLHAQITALHDDTFERNNIAATQQVLAACRQHKVPYLLHVSSSVLHSVADDAYTRTKREQENLVKQSGIPHCILRPTLMFGWFDPKHFGWLSRFMEHTPVFPIPGDGEYLRQPLYNRDFCRVLLACLESRREGLAYDIVGKEDVDYVSIIKAIKEAKALQTVILHIPFDFFDTLLKLAAKIMRRPPFTSAQLHALAAGDYFVGVDIEQEFGVTPTPFLQAITETFTHPVYSKIVVKR
ncbi:MAG: NAD-dependent epimerase/dehydratase family protein [Pseudomonadales bacterium]|jgi:nucleoside-diphosphate-sugar epimerase|nr:NAD-dependent epimerase/dehydratase family protein [Pseudomonadales bacterium]